MGDQGVEGRVGEVDEDVPAEDDVVRGAGEGDPRGGQVDLEELGAGEEFLAQGKAAVPLVEVGRTHHLVAGAQVVGLVDRLAGLGKPLAVEVAGIHHPVAARQVVRPLVERDDDRIDLVARGAAGREDAQGAAAQLGAQIRKHVFGEEAELVRLPEEIGLVVGDQDRQLAQLAVPLGMADQEAVVLRKGRQVQPFQPGPQPVLEQGPPGRGKHEPEVGADEVGKKFPFLVGEVFHSAGPAADAAHLGESHARGARHHRLHIPAELEDRLPGRGQGQPAQPPGGVIANGPVGVGGQGHQVGGVLGGGHPGQAVGGDPPGLEVVLEQAFLEEGEQPGRGDQVQRGHDLDALVVGGGGEDLHELPGRLLHLKAAQPADDVVTQGILALEQGDEGGLGLAAAAAHQRLDRLGADRGVLVGQHLHDAVVGTAPAVVAQHPQGRPPDHRAGVAQQGDDLGREAGAARRLQDLEGGGDAVGLEGRLEVGSQHVEARTRHLAERVGGGGALLAALRAQAGAEGGNDVGLAQSPQGPTGGGAHVGFGVLHACEQRAHRARVERAAGEGAPPHAQVAAAQELEQGGLGLLAAAAEERRRPAGLFRIGAAQKQVGQQVPDLEVHHRGAGGPGQLDVVAGEQRAQPVDEPGLLPGLGQSRPGPGSQPGAGRVPLEDGGHRPQHLVALGDAVIRVEQLDQGPHRLGRADAAERLDGRLGENLVRAELEQRPHRPGIAQLAQRHHRRELQPEVGAQQADQGRDRLDRLHVAERLDGRLGDVAVGVVEQRQQGAAGGAVVDERQDLHREHGHFAVPVDGELQQMGNGVGALPLERGKGRVPQHGVLAVAEECTERLGREVARGQGDGPLAHESRGIAQRRHDDRVAVPPLADGALELGNPVRSLSADREVHAYLAPTVVALPPASSVPMGPALRSGSAGTSRLHCRHAVHAPKRPTRGG